jgi:hypothetical protein
MANDCNECNNRKPEKEHWQGDNYLDENFSYGGNMIAHKSFASFPRACSRLDSPLHQQPGATSPRPANKSLLLQ